MRHLRRLAPAVGLLALSVLATACPPPPPPPAPLVIRDPASLGEANALGDSVVFGGSVSRDGRFIVFASASTNVQSTPPSSSVQLYLRDLQTGAVQKIADAQASGRISANGRYVTYANANGTAISVWDRTTQQTRSFTPPFSTNIVPFVSDHGTTVVWGSTNTLSSSPGKVCAARDLPSGVDTFCPPPPAATAPGDAELVTTSRNTRFVLYRWTSDFDPSTDGYKVWDRSTGAVVDITTPSTFIGSLFGGAVSDDGRYIAAVSGAGPNPGPTVIDLATNTLTQLPNVSLPGFTQIPDMSSDGRFVALVTNSGALSVADINGVTDVYVWDTADNSIELASYNLEDGTTLAGASGACAVFSGAVTDDGQVCVRTPESMVSLDTNGKDDNYLVAAD